MRLSEKKIAQALYQATENKKPSEIQEVIDRLFQWLSGQRLMKLAPAIMTALERIHREKQGVLLVRVASHTALTATQEKELQKRLEQNLQTKIELLLVQDETIIGGYRLSYGDTVYDTTLNKQLNNLQRALIN